MDKTMKWVRSKAELHGWHVNKEDNDMYMFSQYSPAGEDFFFEVRGKNAEEIIDEVIEYASDFDEDEHIEMWIEARRNGFGGVPNTRTLVHDAEILKEWLEELACVLAQ